MVQVAGLSLALSLATLHAWFLWRGGRQCGCFGDYDPSHAAIFGVLAVGAGSTALMILRRSTGRPVRTLVVALGVVAGSALATGPMWVQSRASGSPADGLAYSLRSRFPDLSEARVIVGDVRCEECMAELKASMEMDGAAIVFVSRRGAPSSELKVGSGEEPNSLIVADELWWSLILTVPPRLLDYREGVVWERPVRAGAATAQAPGDLPRRAGAGVGSAAEGGAAADGGG
jgi:hypothetical protein